MNVKYTNRLQHFVSTLFGWFAPGIVRCFVHFLLNSFLLKVTSLGISHLQDNLEEWL